MSRALVCKVLVIGLAREGSFTCMLDNSLRMILMTACTKLIPITQTPKATQMIAGTHFQLRVLNFKKQRGGKMYARAQADVAPISSKTAPRSQVSRESAIAETTREVEKIRCRLMFHSSSGK